MNAYREFKLKLSRGLLAFVGAGSTIVLRGARGFEYRGGFVESVDQQCYAH